MYCQGLYNYGKSILSGNAIEHSEEEEKEKKKEKRQVKVQNSPRTRNAILRERRRARVKGGAEAGIN
jgi:hypothetical protein